MKPLNELYKKPEFWKVELARIKPNPFPGRYPTRWRLVAFRGERLVFDYIGRPSLTQMWRFKSFARRTRGHVMFAEFDRSGVIRWGMLKTPTRGFGLTQAHHTLLAFYYPWHDASTLFNPWESPIFHKEIRLTGHKWWVYSPYGKMVGISDYAELLRAYRTWLRKQNLWK